MRNPKAASRNLRSHALNITIVVRLVFILCVLSESAIFECDGIISSFFETHPKDVTTLEGGTATFSCTVLQFDPNTETLGWHVIPDEYPTVISDYYDESSQNKTSMIAVSNVGRNEQTFKCVLDQVVSLYDEMSYKTYSSRISTMHVQYFPKNNEIRCGSSPLGELHEGHLLEVWCRVQKSNPSVNLSWKINRINLFNASFTESHLVSEGQKMTLNQEVYLSYHLHAKTLYCVASSVTRVFLNQQISCSIGPLLVRHKPRVVIYRTELPSPDDYHELKQVNLNCVATGYPEENSYSWYCSPPNILIGFNNSTSETVQLKTKLDSTLTASYSVVSCSVTNAEGTTTAELILSSSTDVVTDIVGTARSTSRETSKCENASLRLNILNESVNWETFSFEAHAVCFLYCLEQTHGTDVFITWFVNGNQIENDSNHVQYSSSSLTSYITVNGSFQEYDIIHLSCETLSNIGTLKESVNLTLLQPLKTHFHVDNEHTSSSAYETSKNETKQDNDNGNVIHQTEITTSAWDTEKNQTRADQVSWSNPSGVQIIIFVAVAVLGGLLLTACLCAFCTVFLFKYLQRINPRDRPSQRCHDHRVPVSCVSYNVSQKEGCLGQSDHIDYNEDILYEEPLTLSLPPLPPVMSNRKMIVVDEDVRISETDSSLSSDVSYQSFGSLPSNKSSNFPSDVSIPSDFSERDGSMHAQFQGEGKICSSLSNTPDHEYDNAGIIRMHMLPRSVSLSRRHIQNAMNETEFPLPPLPISMKSKPIQRL